MVVLPIPSDQMVLAYFVIFIIFVVVAYRFFKFLFKAFLLGLIASLFPLFANMFFGLSIEISLYSMAWFGITGIGIYVAYVLLKILWKSLKTLTFPFKIFRKKKND